MMKHKLTGKLLSGLTAVLLVGLANPLYAVNSETSGSLAVSVTDSNRSALLGVENPDAYFLGVASQFSVFLHEDFDANGSDCEGRLAAGGNANVGTMDNYSVGAKLEEGFSAAKVVVGGDTLTNFQPNDKKFVIGEYGTVDDMIRYYHEIGACTVYEGALFDFDEEFALLNERSQYLKTQEDNATLEIDQYFTGGWSVYGSDPNLNVLTLDDAAFDIFDGGYLELKIYIPEGSYLVINVPGESVNMPLTNVKLYDTEGTLLLSAGENMPLLYNLYEAADFHYTGSIQGSTLAPNADASGDEGGHVAGATIAKSFKGGIEFGYSAFNPEMLVIRDEITVPETTTTITTTTTTTTTSTTTTTTTQPTTTSTTTTTTQPATTSTTTTTTTQPPTTSTTTTTTQPTTTSTTMTETTITETSKETADAITDAAETTTSETTKETADAITDPAETTASPATETTEAAATTAQTTTTTASSTTTAASASTTTSPSTGDGRGIYAAAAVLAVTAVIMAGAGMQSKKRD